MEEIKWCKFVIKVWKLVELMMVFGIGMVFGFEEWIRFLEIEIVDSNVIDMGVMYIFFEGNYINGWDVNVVGVWIIFVK